MRRIINYFKESYNELMNKVTWPSWAELQGSSIIVMVASVIFALIILAMDYSFKNIMHLVYSLF